MEATGVLVVGAGHAGAELAFSLRRLGFQKSVLIVGDEASLPYQRPPLSKAFLCGEMSAGELLIKPESAYARAHIGWRHGCRVAGIERASKSVLLEGGEIIAYEKLVIATGGRARELQWPEFRAGNCHTLRSRADVERLRPTLVAGTRLVIIGAGYVGLEVAASAVSIGVHVTVVERDSRVMARVAPEVVSAFYQREHERAGVQFELSAGVERLIADSKGQNVEGVVISRANGLREALPANVVLFGIGMIPNTELASQCGLLVEEGIVVDECGLTSDPDIIAIGDCTSQPFRRLNKRVRVESVSNAVDQARAAAAMLCGRERSAVAQPWFWSDQYDLKLQMVGLSDGHDEVIVRGEADSRSFSVFFGSRGELISATCVNAPKEFVFARRLLGADPRMDLRQLARGPLPSMPS